MAVFELDSRFHPDFRIPGKKPVGPIKAKKHTKIRPPKDSFYFTYDGVVRNTHGTINGVINTDASISIVDGKRQLSLGTDTSTIDRVNANGSGSYRNDITVISFVTPRRKLAGAEVNVVGRWNTGASSGSNEWQLTGNFHTTNSDFDYSFNVEIGGSRYRATNSTEWVIGVQDRLAGVRRGTQIELHRAGFAKVTTTGVSSSQINDVSARKTYWGAIDGGAGFNSNMDHELTLIFDYALTDGEIQAVFDDPYQFIEPINAPLYFTAAAGGTTASPPNGTLTYTGQTPVIATTNNQTVSPAQDTLSYTGQVPVINTGDAQVVSPANGSLSYTGQTPVVTASNHQTVSPAQDTLAYTGQVPVVVQGNNQTVQPGNDTLSYAGQVPVVTASDFQVVQPANDTLSYTGQAPAVNVGGAQTVQVGNDTLVYTGQVPTIVNPVSVSPANDDLSYTGQAPTVTASDSQVVQPGNATLALSGFAPVSAVTNNQTVQPANDTLSLVGQSPTATASDHITISPPKGDLTLVSSAPVVSVAGPQTVSPANGNVTYLGYAPTVSGVTTFTPSFRTVTIASESRLLTISA